MVAGRAQSLIIACALFCAIAGTTAAQDHGYPLHAEPRPNYLAAILPAGAETITLPAPPPGEPPAAVRAIYLNAWVFGGPRFYDLVRLADTTEINAFVVDVKDATGYLTYRSSIPTAVEIGANGMIRARDVAHRLAVLREHGIHPIARIVVAKDPLLAVQKSDWAVRDSRGGFWHDRIDSKWVDAYTDSIWIYAADIAAEAVLMGFREIQFDYVRFPDEPPELLQYAVFPGRRGRESFRAAVRRNVALMRERTRHLGVPFTLDLFGLTTSANGDLGIGQVWEDLAPLADVLLPMVYPSHYGRGAYGIRRPNSEPYAVAQRALQDALARSARLAKPIRIRPFFQAFTIYRVRYDAEKIRAQITAAEELGIMEWVLWNPRGVYPAGAFRAAAPVTRTVVDDDAESMRPR